MRKSITHKPMRMDRKTKTERSLFFLTAIIPAIKAIMPAGNTIPTVTSHQRSSNESFFSTLTNTIEAAVISKKKVFSPTDHLPNRVFGTKEIPIILFYQIFYRNAQRFGNFCLFDYIKSSFFPNITSGFGGVNPSFAVLADCVSPQHTSSSRRRTVSAEASYGWRRRRVEGSNLLELTLTGFQNQRITVLPTLL